MRRSGSMTVLFAWVFCGTTTLTGQETPLPQPGPELDVFKSEVGTWDVKIKTWTGPGEPTVTEGTETNRMLGGFWMLTDFQGSMMGMDFKGHGMYGYDAEKRQYIGTWVDSLSPNKMEMIGRYDKDNDTMTYEGLAPGVDGKPAKHVLSTEYKDDGTRVMTMRMQAGEDMMKVFELTYAKAKAADG